MIRLSFNTTDRRVALALKAKGPQIVQAEARTLDKLMFELQTVVQRKLSGEVLKSHAGGLGLLGTVRKIPTAIIGDHLVGGVQAGGGRFWWARVHELGGEKTYTIEPVNKQALAFFPGGSAGAAFGTTAMTRLKFKRGHHEGELRPGRYGEFAAAGGIVVKHVEHPPLKKRSFMESALLELRSKIISDVFRTAAGAIRQ